MSAASGRGSSPSSPVVVAMSGGVDSSVAAALLVEQGYDVIGVMMRLWVDQPAVDSDPSLVPIQGAAENRCCTPQAVEDARYVAAHLGIPFYLVNYATEFKACVVDYFLDEYSQGRTPNPCLACNRQIRFGRLLRHAEVLGANYLATGHYARIDQANGQFRLRAGADPQKDQSYVLYMLGQTELAKVLFPVGGHTKSEVRALARDWGLPVADKEESMELCFLADDDYRRFLRERAPHAVNPGPILDAAGKVLGQHPGLPFYTVGQRKGLGISAAEALYVLRLDVKRNALIVGPARELGRRTLVAYQVHYVGGIPPQGSVRVRAKIRYKAAFSEATWMPLGGDQAYVAFDAPLRDITPGQAVVAYQGDEVLGGGIIGE